MRNPYQLVTSAYDAIIDRGRRKSPSIRVEHEDALLKDRDRAKLVATNRDVVRNFAVAKWMVQKHLDFVSSFGFQSASGNPEFDDEVEAFVGGWSQRHRCDIARRHPLRRFVRLLEARRTIDGDVGVIKVAGQPGGPLRGKLQAVEGDRIAYAQADRADRFDKADWPNGVNVAPGGAALRYMICDRSERGRLTFSRVVPAKNMILYGSFDRFDQTRGVSPMAAALTTLQDTYEGFDYALAKLKLAQMFGLATYTNERLTERDANNPQVVDFGRGPVHLELEPDEKAEFLESKTPAAESNAFLQTMIMVALKSLDLPLSFYDESHTNFYGSRGALIQYQKSCKTKIADLQEVLDELTRWRLGMAVADGELNLPGGYLFEDLRWEWVPAGVPWWDSVKEVTGSTMAIGAGLSDYQRVCRESGTDFYENVDKIAAQQAYAAERGVSLHLAGVNLALVDRTGITSDETDQP